MKEFFGKPAGKFLIIAAVCVCVAAVFLAKQQADSKVETAAASPAPAISTIAPMQSAAATATQESAETAEPVEIQLDLPLFIEFGADWCTYCKQMEPVLEELRQDYDGRIDFEYVDIDENPDIANNFGVQGVPYYVVVDTNGKARLAFSGATTKEVLQEFILEGLDIAP